MNGYLIAEEGPLSGMTILFEEGLEENEWSLGRDPETSDVVLEDPMVSRKHAIVRLTPEGFILENLSTVNPVTQNGMVIVEPVLLKEGDIIQIGSTFFHFTEKPLEPSEPFPPLRSSFRESEEEGKTGAEMAADLHFGPHPETRWLLKVISGPNAGAEFAMHRSSTYLIGKDPNICDIVFQDLSVSRQHARLTIDGEENAFIEDLGSRNGVIINGELISEKHLLATQDLVALGTTTFLVIDRHEVRETIISPPAAMPMMAPTAAEKGRAKEALKEKRDWKELIIPKKHLIFAAVFAVVLLSSIFGMLSLFKTEPVIVKQIDEGEKIKEAIAKFSGVKFSFNQPSGKLFLIGHISTTVDHQELVYILNQLPFIRDMEDNTVVDELVWQSVNGLLSTNPDWVAVSMYAPQPGRFVLRGYVQTLDQNESLKDYMNRNFDYLEQLENAVIVENVLQTEIEGLLMEKGLTALAFELSNGEVILSGRVGEKEEKPLEDLVHVFKQLPGIRVVKNYVAIIKGDTSRVDITSQYQITGYSKRDEKDFFVVINGRILGQGDLLDGMLITHVKPKMVLLEKEGVKFKIDYNIQ